MAQSGIVVSWGATHRDGICIKCQIPFEEFETGEFNDLGVTTVRKCPKCGGKTGNLIVRFAGIAPPPLPDCVKLSCLWSYLIESLTFALIVSYHRRRVAYAEANRYRKILERYRTGEPSPETLWQALHANIKLTCPLCRRIELRRREDGSDTESNQ